MKFIFKGRQKISWKLTMIYTSIFIVVLLILNGAVFLGLQSFVRNNAMKDINNTLEFITPFLHLITRDSFNVLQEISQSGQNIFFRILAQDQSVIAQSRLLYNLDIPLQEGIHFLETDGHNFIYKNIILIRNGYLNGYLQIVRDVTLEYHFLKFLSTILMITSVIGSLGAIITGFYITQKTLKPISTITNTAQKISISDLGRRLDISGADDELTNLAKTFNSMLNRLENEFKKQQRFVSDASHELRTPISVIKGYIDLLDRWGKNEKEIREEAITAIKKEIQGMKILVENLLFLARGDSDRIQINKELFNINELIEEVMKETEMLAEGIKIYSKEQDSFNYYGDRILLKQMLRIFIDNSIKYTPKGGEIIIELNTNKKYLELLVTDTGIGIPLKDQAHIFDRFYRVDKARSAEDGGSGLGLAIAKLIIETHQGKVELISKLDKGTKIRVLLPWDNIKKI